MTQSTANPHVANKEKPTIDSIITDLKLSRALFYHLSDKDLSNCALVNRSWYRSVTNTRQRRRCEITVELLDKLHDKNKKFSDHNKKFKYATEVIVLGWSRDVYIPRDFYDNLFTSKLLAKSLILRGRGNWDSCRCPKQASSVCGEQFDTIEDGDITNLESIHVDSAFRISSCALLDLVSRSPKLKVLRFLGSICKTDHNIAFASKRFYSDIERLYWPWPKKKYLPTLTALVKRNENIKTFHSNAETTCELLSSDTLLNLRFLSICLSEEWSSSNGHMKKAYKHLDNIKYLSQAKNVEALEVRTFDIEDDSSVEVSRVFEQYRVKFWQQVSEMSNLKYLAVYGDWELEEASEMMVRVGLRIQYLKINLMPRSVIDGIAEEKDEITLSMANGFKSLRKLTQLRSLHYICFEKLGSIDKETVTALKEMIDKIWAIDIKVAYTEEIEELLICAVKRGNQLGKQYNVKLHVVPGLDNNYCNLLIDHTLKFSSTNTLPENLRTKLMSIAEAESKSRFGAAAKVGVSFYIWGLEQKYNIRVRQNHELLEQSWHFYNEKFQLNPAYF